MKFGIQYTFNPTPTKIKHAADAISGALGVTGLATISGYPKFSLGISCFAFVLKAISNFFSE